jgi:hypothetical protein
MKLLGCFVFCFGEGKFDSFFIFSFFYFLGFLRGNLLCYIMNDEWWDVKFNFIDIQLV